MIIIVGSSFWKFICIYKRVISEITKDILFVNSDHDNDFSKFLQTSSVLQNFAEVRYWAKSL